MQKTFASAHILTILYKDEGKLHYFRVTTLLAGKPASQPLPENRRAFPVNGGIPAAITRRKRLSPRLLTGDGLPVPCCRFAPANGSLKAVIRGSRVLLKAFDEMLGV